MDWKRVARRNRWEGEINKLYDTQIQWMTKLAALYATIASTIYMRDSTIAADRLLHLQGALGLVQAAAILGATALGLRLIRGWGNVGKALHADERPWFSRAARRWPVLNRASDAFVVAFFVLALVLAFLNWQYAIRPVVWLGAHLPNLIAAEVCPLPSGPDSNPFADSVRSLCGR